MSSYLTISHIAGSHLSGVGDGVSDIVLFPSAVANGNAVARRSAATKARAAMADIEHLAKRRGHLRQPYSPEWWSVGS
jgi:hypothetical protein